MATQENGRRRRQLSVAELTHVWEQVEGGTEADDRATAITCGKETQTGVAQPVN